MLNINFDININNLNEYQLIEFFENKSEIDNILKINNLNIDRIRKNFKKFNQRYDINFFYNKLKK
jgi:hypothetical protein